MEILNYVTESWIRTSSQKFDTEIDSGENRTLCGLIANEYEAPALITKTEYIIAIISSR